MCGVSCGVEVGELGVGILENELHRPLEEYEEGLALFPMHPCYLAIPSTGDGLILMKLELNGKRRRKKFEYY